MEKKCFHTSIIFYRDFEAVDNPERHYDVWEFREVRHTLHRHEKKYQHFHTKKESFHTNIKFSVPIFAPGFPKNWYKHPSDANTMYGTIVGVHLAYSKLVKHFGVAELKKNVFIQTQFTFATFAPMMTLDAATIYGTFWSYTRRYTHTKQHSNVAIQKIKDFIHMLFSVTTFVPSTTLNVTTVYEAFEGSVSLYSYKKQYISVAIRKKNVFIQTCFV